jgi:hypothetical protein
MINKSPERSCAEVVDPLDRRPWIGDDVLGMAWIEIAKLHELTSPLGCAPDQFLHEQFLNSSSQGEGVSLAPVASDFP